MIVQIEQAVQKIFERTNIRPMTGVILGTGLNGLRHHLTQSVTIPFQDFSFLPTPTVAEHRGEFILGYFRGHPMLIIQGRLHYYEGYSMQEITLPVRMAFAMGINTLVVSSACGSLNPDIPEGVLMLVNDHINLMGTNPLLGPNIASWGPRFPNLAFPYDRHLLDLARTAGISAQVRVYEGVHAAVPGPYFMTRAESKMVRLLGADTIGMSMVPEVIVANHAGIRCLGIACVTDAVFPPDATFTEVSHDHVLASSSKIEPLFERFLMRFIELLNIS